MAPIESKSQVRVEVVSQPNPLHRLIASVGIALLATLALALVGAAVAATGGF